MLRVLAKAVSQSSLQVDKALIIAETLKKLVS